MSNPEIPASKLERIRALLTKAERTDNEHEREAFMAAATAQMAKYGIEQATLEASDPGRRTRPIRRDVYLPEGTWWRQRADLAWHIAEAMRCRALIFTGKDGKVAIVGYESDVERAEMMFTSLLLQMSGELARLRTPYGEQALSYRKAWLVGYRSRVVARIRDMERQASQEAEQTAEGVGTALMLRDRSMMVAATYTEEFADQRIRKGKASKVSRNGYMHGQAAGDRANLGGTGLENRRNALTR
jgi:hypothetical protein